MEAADESQLSPLAGCGNWSRDMGKHCDDEVDLKGLGFSHAGD